MRIAFSVVLLAGAVFYSYVAFVDLSFLTRTGRLGPGFFPRLIGVSAVIVLLWVIFDQIRERATADDGVEEPAWRDAVLLMALAVGYAVLIRMFGGFVATFLFLALTLTLLNRGSHLKNLAIAALVPVFVYVLFDRVLNANMPPALFELPL